MITLHEHPIDTQSLLGRVTHPDAGAVVLFVGTTRRMTNGRETTRLQYECYEKMAEQTLAELERQARQRWPIKECLIVHRTGHVAIAEASVAVAVSTAHRRDAFEAGQWLIDRLKQIVPIWKQEHFADGARHWVHPGLESSSAVKLQADHDAT